MTTRSTSHLVIACVLAGSFSLPAAAQTLFSDDFDLNSAAGWTVSSSSADTSAIFAWDYSALGIPSAPNSAGGTTRGLRFAANIANGATAGISASPTGLSLSGDYTMRFDLWINANGPFPAGGAGSTEYFTAGVSVPGNTVQWTSSASPTARWFTGDGENGSARDWRAYVGGTEQNAASGVYAGGTDALVQSGSFSYYLPTFPGQQPPALQQANYAQQTGTAADGSPAFAWHAVDITKTGDQVTFAVDGLPIATLAGATDGNVFVGYMDIFASLSNNADLSFGVVDNVRVAVVPEPSILCLGALGVGALWLARRRR